MFLMDSRNKVVLAYEYGAEVDTFANERAFVMVPTGVRTPDGLTVDEKDCIWSAHRNGWWITRYRSVGPIREVSYAD